MRSPLFLITTLLLTAGLISSVVAEEAEYSVRRIGTVDLQRVFEGYQRTQSSEEELKEFSSKKQSERGAIVSEIRNLREEYILLNEENRLKQRGVIEEKMRGLAQFDDQVKSQIRSDQQASVKVIFDEIEATVEAFAKENEFDLILSDQTVLYGIKTIDVTDQILSRLNKRYAKKGR